MGYLLLFGGQYFFPTSESLLGVPPAFRNNSHELLAFYTQQLSRFNAAAFLPTFQNRRLSMRFNVTSLVTEKPYLNIYNFHITVLRYTPSDGRAYPVCNIDVTLQPRNSSSYPSIALADISYKSICALSLSATNTSVFTITTSRTFPSNFLFRFHSHWSHRQENSETLSWPSWPPTPKCLHSSTGITACSYLTILKHFSARELFVIEQNALSQWSDLQYAAFVQRTLLVAPRNFPAKRSFMPFERANNPSVCPRAFHTWISEYRQWHEKVTDLLLQTNSRMTVQRQRDRLIDLDIRFLVYEKHSTGIADRLTHLISTYLIALLTKRVFIFDKAWPEFTEIMQSSLNYDQQLLLPWLKRLNVLNANLSSTDRKYLSTKHRWFSFDRYRYDRDYNQAFPQRIVTFRAHTGTTIQIIRSNSSIYRKFLTDELQLNTSTIFGCLYHSLFTFKLSGLMRVMSLAADNNPTGYSSDETFQTLLSPDVFPIGVQIRAGDEQLLAQHKQVDRSDSLENNSLRYFERFFQCAQEIVQAYGRYLNESKRMPVVFLVSDDHQLRRAALKRWPFSLESFRNESQRRTDGFHILTSAKRIFHVEFTDDVDVAFQLGIYDMFLFSLCDQHLITEKSGFGRIPSFASLKLRHIHSFKTHTPKTCPIQGIPLEKAGYHWSAV